MCVCADNAEKVDVEIRKRNDQREMVGRSGWPTAEHRKVEA